MNTHVQHDEYNRHKATDKLTERKRIDSRARDKVERELRANGITDKHAIKQARAPAAQVALQAFGMPHVAKDWGDND